MTTESRPGERRLLVALAVVLGLAFVAMPAWRGASRGAGESAAVNPAAFEAQVDAMVARYRVGDEDGLPVVRPPPGDVYLVAERWHFRPLLELEAGQSYRLHVASEDILHGVVSAGQEALLAPGRAVVLTVTPTEPGKMAVVCSEYCGLEHNKMRNWVTVIAKP
jgi:cytochrome c oxidase subunit 2